MYSEIEEGDEFGSFDILMHCILFIKNISDIDKNESIQRCLQAIALTKITLFKLSTENLE